MATFLFDDIIFGPVKSRRLGISLGVNLLPVKSKVCSFDCIYCECGWTNSHQSGDLPSTSQVKEKMRQRLEQMNHDKKELDAITFAGNGEPTLHPGFADIIDETISLRNKFFPDAKIAVLSNSSMLFKKDIVEALRKVDQNILKLDSGFDSTIKLLNKPHRSITVSEIIQNLKQFNGDFILQTLFVRGTYNGKVVDNTTSTEIARWLEIVKDLKPQSVMVYTIARDTPIDTLQKIPLQELNSIAQNVESMGIPAYVSG